ncbi:MAG TPA: hypothetical protein DF292_04720 [Firmicutes bacterium]|jgi:CRISPR-associated protein Csx10|nr:hypothetical protein [Bacillota bacterium]
MYELEYKVTLQAPVLISNITDENTINTMDYLPGSSILGVFAAQYIRKKDLRKSAHEDADFYNWFLNGQLNFSDAFLAINHDGQSHPGYPIPFYLQKEKGTEHIINCFGVTNQQHKTANMAGYGWFGNEFVVEQPLTKIHFHHARTSRLAGHSTDGLIFNYEAIEPGQTFIGTICGMQAELEKFAKCFDTPLDARIGRSRQTEYGAIRIELGKALPVKYEAEIFQSGLDANEVVIALLSPCILENEYGFSDPSEKQFHRYLAAALGLQHQDFTIQNRMVKTVKVETSLSVWGMKRPSVTALAAGSAFQLQFEKLSSDICQQLAELAHAGLGERTQEGFGRLGFNMAMNEHYQGHNRARVMSAMPNGPAPQAFIGIFKDVLSNELRQRIVSRAIRDAEQFKTARPTNSLCGKMHLMLGSAGINEAESNVLSALRKPARSQLEQCHNGKDTLFNFIKQLNTNKFDELIANLMHDWETLNKQISYAPDPDAKTKLFHLYWQTFFHKMRALNNATGGEEE